MMALALAAALSCMNPRVIDGDTLVCAGESVRLHAINARESNDTCRTYAAPGIRGQRKTAPCPRTSGKAARDELRRLTAGRRVQCTPTGHDRYGRTVARCRVGTTDIGCSLVRTGHAAEWRQFGRAC